MVDVILGVLGWAQQKYPVKICCFSFVSTHYHMILQVESGKRLAEFVGYFNSNLAREVNRLTGWNGSVWSRRYRSILISKEEGAVTGRCEYVLAHGVKENPSPTSGIGLGLTRCMPCSTTSEEGRKVPSA